MLIVSFQSQVQHFIDRAEPKTEPENFDHETGLFPDSSEGRRVRAPAQNRPGTGNADFRDQKLTELWSRNGVDDAKGYLIS